MSKAFSRTLTIHSQDLGQEATVLLTFDSQSMPGLYNDYFPTAWQVTTFGATGRYAMTSTYKNQLAFIKPQVLGNIIVGASTWIDIGVGQQTTLTDSNIGLYSFSTPNATPPPHTTIQAWNETNASQSIGVGFDIGSLYPPASVLFFNPIPVKYNVTAEFTPTLTAYIVTNYQQNQILRGAIQSSAIWSKDLTDLAPTTSWTLSKNAVTGKFQLTLDQPALAVQSPALQELNNFQIISDQAALGGVRK